MQRLELKRVALFGWMAFALSAVAQTQTPILTEWGDPDLRGLWSSASLTPFERPLDMADKTHFTEAEAEAIRGTGMERTLEALSVIEEFKLSGELNEVFLEPGTEVVRSRSTSLVVDPPNGRVPATPEGARRRLQVLFKRAPNAPSDSHEDRHLGDRCLLTGTLFIPNPFYLNNHHIFQSHDHVAILSEYDSEVRIIPLDGRPPLNPNIRQWAGSSRGHFEGQSLVIETTNFNGRGYFQGATDGLRLVERFTRVDEQTVDYQLTASDPASYTQPWTLENTLRATEGPIYEYACHEGNQSLPNILRGARYMEKMEREKAEKGATQDGARR